MTKARPDHASELPETAPCAVWIEDTRTAVHGHGGPGWEFGSCLWSPSSADGGSDYYALMREPAPGDLVIHFNDGAIVGWSRVAGAVQELVDPPPSPAQWAGPPSYYRIALTEYRAFPRSVRVSDFVARNQTAISEEGAFVHAC